MTAQRLICSLLACLWSLGCAAASPVLLISLDGLHPAYVTDADRHGLKIPALRRLLETGAHASGVVGVVPTVTYPTHTTIMTGVAPDVHGILSNTPFDPLNVNREGWYWYAEDIKVQTLWEAAASARLRTASVNWPVTVGDRHIAFLLPEYWRAGTAEDLKVMRQLDRPQLMAVHLIALDEVEHEHGPFVREAYETLEQLDQMVGELIDAAVASDPATVIAVVSDHGFIATHTVVNLRTRFVEAGLIKLKQTASGAAAIEDWQAQLWSGAASAAVVLRDPANKEVRNRVSALLQSLAAEPRNGIGRILDKAALQAAGAFPSADFLVEFAPGFYFGTELRGELLRPGVSKGTHGYLPSRPETHSSLFMRGAGIDAGRDLGVVDMRQIAPTLAGILGVRLPQKTLPALQLSSAPRSE